jgi:hypothetical protein
LLLLLGPTASSAEPEPVAPDFSGRGAYARLGFEIGVPNFSDVRQLNRELATGTGPPPPPGTTLFDREYGLSNFAGVGFAIGYRLHRRVALEGALTWMGGQLYADSVDGSVPSDPVVVSEKRADLGHLWVGVNGKVFILTGRVQPFAIVGFGMLRVDRVARGGQPVVSTGVGGRFGGGFDVYLTRSLAVDASLTYDLGMGATEGTDQATFALSLLYRF